MSFYSCSHISEPEICLPLKPQPHDPYQVTCRFCICHHNIHQLNHRRIEMIYITIKNYRLYNSSLQRYVFKILKKKNEENVVGRSRSYTFSSFPLSSHPWHRRPADPRPSLTSQPFLESTLSPPVLSCSAHSRPISAYPQ